VDKSYVSMEQHVCPICTVKFDTNSILLDRRLKDSMERHTTTGSSICPKCTDMLKDRIALVGADSEKSDYLPNGNMSPEGAYRTGEIIWMKRSVAKDFINVETENISFIFTDQKVIDQIKQMMEE